MATVFEEMTAIADAIREKTGGTDKLTLGGIASAIPDVYAAGYTEGEAVGMAEGIEQGRQAEYDEFWNDGILSGTQTDWQYAFAGKFWNDNTFNLPYKIKPTGSNARYMFMRTGIKNGKLITDKVDFSGITACVHLFYQSLVEELGIIDFSSLIEGWGGLNQPFVDCKALRKILLLILPKSSCVLQNGFWNCDSLTDITLQGTAYQSVNFQWSPLNKPSINSVFSCLGDTVAGQTATFKQTAVDNAFETSEGAADGSTSEEWLALVASKSNWTVSLV